MKRIGLIFAALPMLAGFCFLTGCGGSWNKSSSSSNVNPPPPASGCAAIGPTFPTDSVLYINNRTKLVAVRADGLCRMDLGRASDVPSEFKFSPDGRFLDYGLVGGGCGATVNKVLPVSNLDISKGASFASGQCGINAQISFRPDSQRIVYRDFATNNLSGGLTSATVIATANPDGTGRTVIVPTGAGRFDSPIFINNGAQIALVRTDAAQGIYVMNANGSNLHRVLATTDTPQTSLGGPVSLAAAGNLLLFTASSAGSDSNPTVSIYSVGQDGSNRRLVAQNVSAFGFVVFPNGSQIVFPQVKSNGKKNLVRVAVSGGTPVALTNGNFNDDEPTVSADSSKIAFRSDRDGNDEIYVINADGSHLTRLTNNFSDDDSPLFR